MGVRSSDNSKEWIDYGTNPNGTRSAEVLYNYGACHQPPREASIDGVVQGTTTQPSGLGTFKGPTRAHRPTTVDFSVTCTSGLDLGDTVVLC